MYQQLTKAFRRCKYAYTLKSAVSGRFEWYSTKEDAIEISDCSGRRTFWTRASRMKCIFLRHKHRITRSHRGCHVKQMTENKCWMPGVWISFQSRLRSSHWKLFPSPVFLLCWLLVMAINMTLTDKVAVEALVTFVLAIFAVFISFLVKEQENTKASQNMCFKFAKTKCNGELIWTSSKAKKC